MTVKFLYVLAVLALLNHGRIIPKMKNDDCVGQGAISPYQCDCASTGAPTGCTCTLGYHPDGCSPNYCISNSQQYPCLCTGETEIDPQGCLCSSFESPTCTCNIYNHPQGCVCDADGVAPLTQAKCLTIKTCSGTLGDSEVITPGQCTCGTGHHPEGCNCKDSLDKDCVCSIDGTITGCTPVACNTDLDYWPCICATGADPVTCIPPPCKDKGDDFKCSCTGNDQIDPVGCICSTAAHPEGCHLIPCRGNYQSFVEDYEYCLCAYVAGQPETCICTSQTHLNGCTCSAEYYEVDCSCPTDLALLAGVPVSRCTCNGPSDPRRGITCPVETDCQTGDRDPKCKCTSSQNTGACICTSALHAANQDCVCDQAPEATYLLATCQANQICTGYNQPSENCKCADAATSASNENTYSRKQCLFDRVPNCGSESAVVPGECKCFGTDNHPKGCLCASATDNNCLCNDVGTNPSGGCLSICGENEFPAQDGCLCAEEDATCKLGACTGPNTPSGCACATVAVSEYTAEQCAADVAFLGKTACNADSGTKVEDDSCRCISGKVPVGCTCARNNDAVFGYSKTDCEAAKYDALLDCTGNELPEVGCKCKGSFNPTGCTCPKDLTGIDIVACPCDGDADPRIGGTCPIVKVCSEDSINCLCSAAHNTGTCTCTQQFHNPDCVCDTIEGAGYTLATCRADKPCVGSSTTPTGCTCVPIIADGATKVTGCTDQKKCNELTSAELEVVPITICPCYDAGDPREDGECTSTKECNAADAVLTDVPLALCDCQPKGDGRAGGICTAYCAGARTPLGCVCSTADVDTYTPAKCLEDKKCLEYEYPDDDDCDCPDDEDYSVACNAGVCTAFNKPSNCGCPKVTQGTYTHAKCLLDLDYDDLTDCSSEEVGEGCKCTEDHEPEGCTYNPLREPEDCDGGTFIHPDPFGCVPTACKGGTTAGTTGFPCICTKTNHPDKCTCAEDPEEEPTSSAVEFDLAKCEETLVYQSLTACDSEEVGSGCKCTSSHEPAGCTYDPLREPKDCNDGTFEHPLPLGCDPTTCAVATSETTGFPCICSGADNSPTKCTCPDGLTDIPIDKCACLPTGDPRATCVCTGYETPVGCKCSTEATGDYPKTTCEKDILCHDLTGKTVVECPCTGPSDPRIAGVCASPETTDCTNITKDTSAVDCACPTDKKELKADPRSAKGGLCAAGSMRAALSVVVSALIIPALILFF